MIDLKILQAVSTHLLMHVPDDRFETVVGFVSGLDAADGYTTLRRFGCWLADRDGGPSNLVWWAQLARRRLSQLDVERVSVRLLSPSDNAALIGDLFRLLEEFLTLPEAPGVSTEVV